MPDATRFLVDYVYGPYVGRTFIEGATIKEATEKLWMELSRDLWVAERFREIKEVKSAGTK